MNKRRASITATIILILEIGFIAIIPINFADKNEAKVLNIFSIVIYSLLTICYIFIIVFLHRTLKKMNEFGDFNKAQKSVILQFALFLFAFAVNLLIEVLYFSSVYNTFD